jgi:hypothetical protein
MAVAEPVIELSIAPDGSVRLLVDGVEAAFVDELEALVAEALGAPVLSREVGSGATARSTQAEGDRATIRSRRG